ncbi:MAG TPA: RNA polymerase sigma factor [Kofleriaceae bacterium]|nr:RNA polymerase sigma factor [Kofleriaceae bacterium]
MSFPHPVPAIAPTTSDADVIAAVLRGDRAQFAVLVQRHNQTMYRACRAILRDDQDAEDAVQVAWINAFRSLASFRADASFRTWATRIAVNEATTRLRSRRRLAALPMQEQTVDPAADPEHDAFASQLGELLEREIDALPEGLRTVLVMRDVIELDTAETADCLGIEEQNVRVRLHRARHALAERLTQTMHEFAGLSAPKLWRFDGERCARTVARVMAEIEST